MAAEDKKEQAVILVKIDDKKLEEQLKKLNKVEIGSKSSGGIGKAFGKIQAALGGKLAPAAAAGKMPQLDFSKFNSAAKTNSEAAQKFAEAVDRMSELFGGEVDKPTGETGGVNQEWDSSEESAQKAPTGIGKLKGIFDQMNKKLEGMMGNKALGVLPKMLVPILAIASVVALITQSSKSLQALLKLMQTGVMLIFRPIGDFIAAILRPLMVKLLVALYPIMLPVIKWANDYGTKIGNNLAEMITAIIDGTLWEKLGTVMHDALKDLFSFAVEITEGALAPLFQAWDDYVAEVYANWSEFFTNLGDAWNSTMSFLQDAWDATAQWFSDFIIDPLSEAWDAIMEWAQWIGSSVMGFLTSTWSKIIEWALWVGGTVMEALTTTWSAITEWALWVGGTVMEAFNAAWNGIVNWANWLGATVMPALLKGWGMITNWANQVKATIIEKLTAAWDLVISTVEGIAFTLKGVVDFILSLFGMGGNGDGADKPKTNAVGGMIHEPVVGVGTRSGLQYMFAENGPEKISPVNQQSTTQSSNTNVSVNVSVSVGNVSNDVDVEKMGEMVGAKVKKAILDELMDMQRSIGSI